VTYDGVPLDLTGVSTCTDPGQPPSCPTRVAQLSDRNRSGDEQPFCQAERHAKTTTCREQHGGQRCSWVPNVVPGATKSRRDDLPFAGLDDKAHSFCSPGSAGVRPQPQNSLSVRTTVADDRLLLQKWRARRQNRAKNIFSSPRTLLHHTIRRSAAPAAPNPEAFAPST
jgi:hypothetical protein